MKIIYRKKQTGKTTELINISSGTGQYIVCRSFDNCGQIANMARKLGKHILYPMSYREFTQGHFARTIKGFLIDDVEMLLCYMTNGVPVSAITIEKHKELADADIEAIEDKNQKLQLTVNMQDLIIKKLNKRIMELEVDAGMYG